VLDKVQLENERKEFSQHPCERNSFWRGAFTEKLTLKSSKEKRKMMKQHGLKT
jgi:hypothetical protein